MRKNALRSSCVAAMVAGFAIAGFAQTIQVNQNNRTIAVTVTDKATETADIATVHIGFEAYAPDSDAAYAAGSKASNAIIDALHKAGVPDNEIESENQNLRQNFQFEPNESEVQRAKRRFVLAQSWTVHTSAPDAKNVLHIAVEAGANNSGQIDWDVKDRAALQARAAAKALQHAQAVADQMAKGLNAHLGPLLYASNQVPEAPIPLAGQYRAAMTAPAPPPPPPLAINPQKIEESATVHAVFAVE
ncbi:MAG: SIMPL domain-containing protein [Acidobacteriaceae bacterium]